MVTLTSLVLAPAASAKTCAEKVIDDWYGNGRVDQIFPKHCYLEAIRSLPVDVKDYDAPLSDEQLSEMRRIFPQGVCDYSRPGVGHARVNGITLST